MGKYILIVLVLLSPQLAADEIGLFTSSYHFDAIAREKANSDNFGFYYVKHNYIVGGYKNSYNVNSFIIGKLYDLKINKYVEIKLTYGLMSGYGLQNYKLCNPEKYGYKVLPFFTPSLSFKIFEKNLNFHLTYDALAFSLSSKI